MHPKAANLNFCLFLLLFLSFADNWWYQTIPLNFHNSEYSQKKEFWNYVLFYKKKKRNISLDKSDTNEVMCIGKNRPIVGQFSNSEIIDSVINKGKADIDDLENEEKEKNMNSRIDKKLSYSKPMN